MTRNEDRLFARYATHGDPRDLAAACDAVAPRLLALALHLARDEASAEDLLQATLLTAIERARSYDPARPLLPWLTGILTNQARNARRTARGEELPDVEDAAPGPADRAAQRELAERLEESLADVPEAFRPVLRLRLVYGLSAAEIAHALQRPPGTVRSQLARGLEQVRRKLPAGLAGAALVAAGRPARGMQAVRAAVLEQAGAHVAPSLTIPWLSAGLLMKPLVAVGALALILGSAWWALAPERSGSEAVVAPAMSGADRAPADVPGEIEVAARTPAPSPVEPAGAELLFDESIGLEARTTCALEVRALDAGGRPAPGALVLLKDSLDPRRCELSAAADAEGRARFEDLAAGSWTVALLLGGSESLALGEGEAREVELRLHSGFRAVVAVVDERDAPIAGAEVWVSERSNSAHGWIVGRTDARGRLGIEALNAYHQVAARAPGRAMSHQHVQLGLEGETYELVVRLVAPAASLAGRVVGLAGEPLADALVTLAPELDGVRADSGIVLPGPPPTRARTGADGSFELVSLAAGAHRLEVLAEGCAPHREALALEAAAEDFVDVVLRPEARIEGRVLDEHGAAVAGANVATEAFDVQAFTDSQGRFALAALPAGPVQVVALHPELGDARASFELREGLCTHWEPRLVAAPRLFGRVVQASGDPVAHWPVTAMDEELGRAGAHSGLTDAKGRFSIAVDPGRTFSLWVTAPRSWREFPRHIERGLRASTQPLALRLEDAASARGRLVGRVLTPDGERADDVQLMLWHVEQRLWRSFPVEPAEGRIDIPLVPPGTLEIALRSQRHPWVNVGAREVRAGEATDLGTFELERGSAVTGALVGGDEASLETLEFVLAGPDGTESGVVTRDGRAWSTSPLALGVHELHVRGDRVRSRKLSLDLRDGVPARVEIALESALLREVRIELPEDGASARRMWLAALDDAGREVWRAPVLMPDAQGHFAARVSAPAGRYRLVGATVNGLRLEAEIELGETHELQSLRRYVLEP